MSRLRVSSMIIGVVMALIVIGTAVFAIVTGKSPLEHLALATRSSSPNVEQAPGARSRTIPVRTAAVQLGEIEHRIHLTGDVEAELSVQVFSKVAGVLEDLRIDVGDRVRAGQMLGRIEWRELAARVDQATALVHRYRAHYAQLEAGARPEELTQARDRLRKAQAALDHAQRTLDRTRELVERAFVPPQELDNALSAHQAALGDYNIARETLTLVQKGAREEDRQAARAQWEEAEASLRLAELQLGHTTLTAPITGVVAQRYVDQGAFISLTSPVVSIVAMDRVKILGRASDRELATLRLGQQAEVRVDAYANEVFLGQVSRINPTVDRATRTIEIEVGIDNVEHRLKPGMFAHVSIVVETYHNVLLIPRVAVLGQGTDETVYVVNERSAYARPVRTGFRTDDWVVVIEHLREGEEIIVAGQEHVTDGAPVVVVGEGRVVEGGRR